MAFVFGTTPIPNQGVFSVTDVSDTVRDENGKRTNLILQNIGAKVAWLRVGETAVASQSYKIPAGGTFSLAELRTVDEDDWVMGAIHVVCAAAETTTLFFLEPVRA